MRELGSTSHAKTRDASRVADGVARAASRMRALRSAVTANQYSGSLVITPFPRCGAPAEYIQRLFTDGGVAPPSSCDEAAVGMMLDVPYGADYYFFGQ
jgi:hypothetical protein